MSVTILKCKVRIIVLFCRKFHLQTMLCGKSVKFGYQQNLYNLRNHLRIIGNSIDSFFQNR